MTPSDFLTSTTMEAGLPPLPRRYRVSGYTDRPHDYASEVVDAETWERVRAEGARGILKEITTWVQCEPLGLVDPSQG
jgi:hypothetical protein